jgi:hypothetical protein
VEGAGCGAGRTLFFLAMEGIKKMIGYIWLMALMPVIFAAMYLIENDLQDAGEAE